MPSTIILIGGYAVKHLYLALEPFIDPSHKVHLYVDLHFTQTCAVEYADFAWGQLRGDFPWISQGLLPNPGEIDPNEQLTFGKVRAWHAAVEDKIKENQKLGKVYLYQYIGIIEKDEDGNMNPSFKITGDDNAMTTSGRDLKSSYPVNFKEYTGDFHIFDCRRMPTSLGYTGFTIIERFLTFAEFFTKSTIDTVIVGFGFSAFWAAELTWKRDKTQNLQNTYKFIRPIERGTGRQLTDEEIEKLLTTAGVSRNQELIDNQLLPRLKAKNLFVEPEDLYISYSDLLADDKHDYQNCPEKPIWALNNEVYDSELIVFYRNVEDQPKVRECSRMALGIQTIGFTDIDLTGKLKVDLTKEDGGGPSKKYHCFSKAAPPLDIAPPYINGSVLHWLYRGLILVFKTLDNAKYNTACMLELTQLIWVMENATQPAKTYESHLETALIETKIKYDLSLLPAQMWDAYRLYIKSFKARPPGLNLISATEIMNVGFTTILPSKPDAARLNLAVKEATGQPSPKL